MTRSANRPIAGPLLAGAALWNILQNLVVPRRWYGATNLLGSVITYRAGIAAGLSPSEMGLGPGAVRGGFRHAAVPSLLVAGAVATGVTGRCRPLFRDERVAPATVGALVGEIGFQIPVGTALFEEMLFRGLLLGWFSAADGDRAGVVASSVAFGLWHVLPTWRTAAVYRRGVLRKTVRGGLATVAGGVAITTVAGGVLALLRRRSASLIAPIVVHAVVNGSGYAAAWIEARGRSRSAHTRRGGAASPSQS